MKISLCFLLLALSNLSFCQPSKVYLLPGHGADERVFSLLDLPDYDTEVLSYPDPYEEESFSSYARRVAGQIDTAQAFSLVGVSFGGMLSVEIAKHFPPEKIILLSSAKCAQELPYTYRVFRNFPIHKVFNGQFFKWWGIRLQPLLEPIPKADRIFFRSMLRAKRPLYMKRTINYILTWEEGNCDSDIIHIHGAKDKTLPYKNITPTLTLPHAGHMMVYTHAPEISRILGNYLP